MGKKKGHPAHENLERWVVSYADFMTLLFATFTAMFALAQAKLSEQEEQVMAGIRQGFQSQSLIAGIQSVIQGLSPPAETTNPMSPPEGAAGDGVIGDFKSLVAQKGVDEEDQNPVGEEGLAIVLKELLDEMEAMKKQLAQAAKEADDKAKALQAAQGKGAAGKQGQGKDDKSGFGGKGGGNQLLGGSGPNAGDGDKQGEKGSKNDKNGKGGQKPGFGSGKDGQQGGSNGKNGEHGDNGSGSKGNNDGDGNASGEIDPNTSRKIDLAVSDDPRGVRLRLNDTLLFTSGTANLKPEAKKALATLAEALKKYTSNYLLQVEGHTDNQPIGSKQFPSNWELSTARASAVVRYLVKQHGFPRKRMSAAGFADIKPIDSNKTRKGRSANRRIEFLLFTDPAEQPKPQQNSGSGPSTTIITPHQEKVDPHRQGPEGQYAPKKPNRLTKQLVKRVSTQSNAPARVILKRTDGANNVINTQIVPSKPAVSSRHGAEH